MATATTGIRREQIRLEDGGRVTVRIDGRPDGTPTSKGDFQFFLNDGRSIMWVPRECRDAIVASGVQPGQEVTIMRSGDIYTAGRPGTRPSPAQQAAQANPHPTNQSGPRAVEPRGSSHMAQCMILAVDAASEAAEHARQIGFSVTFLGADIRAMANTLMINDGNGGR